MNRRRSAAVEDVSDDELDFETFVRRKFRRMEKRMSRQEAAIWILFTAMAGAWATNPDNHSSKPSLPQVMSQVLPTSRPSVP